MGDCSVHSLTTDFRCSYHGFTLIRTQVIVFLLDLGITKYFMKFFFNFKRVLLADEGVLAHPQKPLILHPWPSESDLEEEYLAYHFDSLARTGAEERPISQALLPPKYSDINFIPVQPGQLNYGRSSVVLSYVVLPLH